MDPVRYDELLSACLDRELSLDERATVERLLEQSSEARERLHDLEFTSRFMRNLPARQLAADFADSVIDRLRNESLLRPEPMPAQPTRRRNVWWVGTPLAAAAAILFALLGIWNYQGGQRFSPSARNPIDGHASTSSFPEAGPAIPSTFANQWEACEVVEIRGPTGEKQFELLVLAMATEPNTIRCVLAESRDREPVKSAPTAPQNEPEAPEGPTTLAIVADQKQLDQLQGLLAQSRDGTGTASPMVDIVTDMELDRIRLAAVGPETRMAGRAGNQEPLAEREAFKIDARPDLAGVSRSQSPPSPADKQQGDSAIVRRARGMPQPPAGAPSKDEQMASVRVVVLPVGGGLPLVIPTASAGEPIAQRSDATLAEKKAASAGPAGLSGAATLQDRDQRVHRIKEINNIPQHSAAAPATATPSVPQRSTAGHVENLAKAKQQPAALPGSRSPRPADSELPRRVEVLLRFRSDRPE